jgi:hypothetical protein
MFVSLAPAKCKCCIGYASWFFAPSRQVAAYLANYHLSISGRDGQNVYSELVIGAGLATPSPPRRTTDPG